MPCAPVVHRLAVECGISQVPRVGESHPAPRPCGVHLVAKHHGGARAMQHERDRGASVPGAKDDHDRSPDGYVHRETPQPIHAIKVAVRKGGAARGYFLQQVEKRLPS
jgi:hypothetical protein